MTFLSKTAGRAQSRERSLRALGMFEEGRDLGEIGGILSAVGPGRETGTPIGAARVRKLVAQGLAIREREGGT